MTLAHSLAALSGISAETECPAACALWRQLLRGDAMLWAALAKPRGARASALRSADVLGCLLDPGALAAIGRPRDEEAAEAAQLSVVALLPAFLGSLDGGDADYVAHSDAVAKFLLTHAVRARATTPHRSSRNAACAARASIERGCRVLGGAVRDSARAGEWP